DRNRSHWSTSKTPSYTKSVSWQHHQEAELKALVNKSDEDIDYSDIPASGSEAWSDAKRGNFLPDPGIHAQ
ncbi:hypothetical protein ACQP3J_22075, partial [Escherichia coli]